MHQVSEKAKAESRFQIFRYVYPNEDTDILQLDILFDNISCNANDECSKTKFVPVFGHSSFALSNFTLS